MLEPGDVDAFEASIKKADFLLLNNEVPEAVNLRAVDLAQRHGTRILFNPAANAAAAQSAERMQAGGSRFRASKILMKTGAYT